MITIQLHANVSTSEAADYCLACKEWGITTVKIKDAGTMNRIKELSDYPHQGGVRLMGITFRFAGK